MNWAPRFPAGITILSEMFYGLRRLLLFVFLGAILGSGDCIAGSDVPMLATDEKAETLCRSLVSESGPTGEFEAILRREEARQEAESPDGRFVLAIEGRKILVTTGGATRELDAGEFSHCGSIGCGGGPESVTVSNDSRYAVTNQTVLGGSTIIWDTENWQRVATVRGRPRIDSAVRFVATQEYSSKHGDQVFLYDVKARELTHVAGRTWSDTVCRRNHRSCPDKSGDFLEKVHGPVRSEGEFLDIQNLAFLPRSSVLAILSRSNQLYLYNAVKRTSHACVMSGCDSEEPFSCDNKSAIISLMERNRGRMSPSQLLPRASERLRSDREVALVAMRQFVRRGCRGCCEIPPIHLLSPNLQADPEILKAAIEGVWRGGSCNEEEIRQFWKVVYASDSACLGEDLSLRAWAEHAIEPAESKTKYLAKLASCVSEHSALADRVDDLAVDAFLALDAVPEEGRARWTEFISDVLRLNAEGGNASSQHNLAVMHNAEPGSTLANAFNQDYGRFVYWTRKAAAQGEPRSLFNLAIRLAADGPTGFVQPDPAMAYLAFQAFKPMIDRYPQFSSDRPIVDREIQKLEKKLGTEQVEELKKRAGSFKLSSLAPTGAEPFAATP